MDGHTDVRVDKHMDTQFNVDGIISAKVVLIILLQTVHFSKV